MGWLDANEYFNMELVARDRANDIHAAIDAAALAGADGEDSRPRSRYRKRSTPVPRDRIFAERATASAWCTRAAGARSDAGACSGAKWW